MSLPNRQKDFKNFSTALAVLTAILPILSKIFELQPTSFIPNIDLIYLVFFYLLGVAIAFLVISTRNSPFWKKKFLVPILMVLLFISAVACFFGYYHFREKWIRCRHIPTLEKSVCVIIGERSKEIQIHKKYANVIDEKILDDLGWIQEKVVEAWNRKSVAWARWYLIGSFLLTLLSLEALFCVGTLKEYLKRTNDSCGG